MRRRPLFAANWKMHKTPAEASEYAANFWAPAQALASRADIVLCAPFVDLETLGVALQSSSVRIGAQDCFWEAAGAYTGEVSAAMLAAMKVTYCIVGHSERRRLFGETDEAVAKKTAALVRAGLTPIVCVGETLEEKRQGVTAARVRAQVEAALGDLTDEQRAQLVIAYEPVWAIGTGLADDPASADETIGIIRAAAGGLDRARVVYGGSMSAKNAAAFCAQPNIDGGLVGSASLDPRGFINLIRNGLNGIAKG